MEPMRAVAHRRRGRGRPGLFCTRERRCRPCISARALPRRVCVRRLVLVCRLAGLCLCHPAGGRESQCPCLSVARARAETVVRELDVGMHGADLVNELGRPFGTRGVVRLLGPQRLQ